jgi:hypothetical protein
LGQITQLVVLARTWLRAKEADDNHADQAWTKEEEVRWDAGENHASGTETGLTALAIEGGTLGLFEPEAPGP